MLPQKNGFGKTAVFVISIVTIIFILASLSLIAAQSQYDQFNYLPIILQDGSPPPPVSPTNTPLSPTATSSPTVSITPSATPEFCGLEIEGFLVEVFDFVYVTGEIGRLVTVIDVTTGMTLGSGTLLDRNGHTCPGFLSVPLSSYLVPGHLILVESDNPHDQFDTAWVLPGTPTYTPIPTNTATPTDTPTNTPTPTLTPTSTGPFIILLPICGSPPNVQFTVQGYNWPQDETIALYWNNGLQSIIHTGSQTSFSQTWQKFGITAGSYEVKAVSANHTATAVFTAPCPLPPTSTPTPTATATAGPVNLIISRPILVSTPPIVAYQPVEFQVSIFNTEITPVDSPFFVDIYLDPGAVFTDSIPLNKSNGYQGIGSIPGLATRVLTITAPLGFQNEPVQHIAYSMVDSLGQIQETDETDNISVPLLISQITPAPTPTATSTPLSGSDTLFGIVYRPTNEGLVPLLRANVTLIDTASSETIATTTSDPITGSYSFQNLLPGAYAVMACGSVGIDGETVLYSGWRTNVTLPYAFPVNVYTESSLSCPN